jgi:fructosamine-3-kinase
VSLGGALAEALAAATGRRVVAARRASGGSINDAWRVELEGGERAFVKTRDRAPAGEYATEAAGLRWLADAGVAVPGVVAVGDGDEGPRFLALEWVQEGRLDDAGAEALGRSLAALHAAGAPAFGAAAPGAPSDDGAVAPMRIGELRLSNEPAADWPSFYAQRRLAPLARLAEARGALSAAGSRAVDRVCASIADLAGPVEPPSRLHGDLWGGNVLPGSDGRARLVDPAAYGGHREVDLAMLRLFGAPPSRVLAAYEEAAPLAPGHHDRVGLWQLFPLLVHAVLFGGSYGEAVERTARRYAG